MFELPRINGLTKSRKAALNVERMEERSLLSTPGIGPVSVLPHVIPPAPVTVDSHNFPGNFHHHHHHHRPTIGNPPPTPTPPTTPPAA